MNGSLDPDDPHLPDLPSADPWQPVLKHRFLSAYRTCYGAEPELTNFAVSGPDAREFCGTLDYLFYCGGIRPRATPPLPKRTMLSVKSLPTALEPSDHLLVVTAFYIPD